MNLKLSEYTNYGKIYRFGIEPPNVNFHHAKMVCPIFKHVMI